MKKYNIFLFDADDTLFDYQIAEKIALKVMLRQFGIELTSELHSFYKKSNMDLWHKFERNEVSSEELQRTRFELLLNKAGLTEDPMEFNKKYLFELGKCSVLNDGAEDICKKIKSSGKEIYIITNGLHYTQESRLKHSTISVYIKDYFISEVVGYRKPEKEFFDFVFNSIGETRSDALIIGDSLNADIAGGVISNTDTCWYNPYKITNGTQFKPTYEIEALDEISKFL